MLRILLLFMAFFGSRVLLCQVTDDYLPITESDATSSGLLTTLDNRYKTDLNTLPKDYKDEVREAYKSRIQHLEEEIKNKNYFAGTPLNQYLNTVLQTVIQNNPEIPAKDIRLLINRETVPNAMCWGEGTLVVNIGLIRRMENESQLAFVICHELSHYMLNHVNQAIYERIKAYNSKATNQQLQEIKKSEYKQTTRAIQLLKGLVYSDRRHSRLHESEADSLAFIFLKNTPYDEKEAIRCLEILKDIDKDYYKSTFDLKKIFENPEIPFKDSWLQAEIVRMNFKEKEDVEWIKDSLKTHPDCKKRIEYLQKLNFGTDKKKFVQSEEKFMNTLQTAQFEAVEGEIFFKNYGKCIYRIAGLMEQYPDNAYLHATLGKCLVLCYEATKNHELNKYTELPTARTESDYKKVLTFVQNLRMKEMASLSYYYLKNKAEKYLAKEEFLYTYCLAAEIDEHPQESKQLAKQYQKQFPKGKYAQDPKIKIP